MLRPAALLLALLALFATRARAAQRVIVLDRGAAAKAERAQHDLVARALLRKDAVLVFCGTRADGRARVGTVRGYHDRAIATNDHTPGWGFEGGSDPRRALEFVARRAAQNVPLEVFLIGPFVDDGEASGWGETWRKTWRENAPEGSRFYPVGLAPQRLPLIDDLPGRAKDGWLVLDASLEKADVAPWSPLDADGIRATLDLRVVRAPIGRPPKPALLRIDTAEPADVQVNPTREGLRATVQISTARDTLRARFLPADRTLWLAALPPPIEVDLRRALRRDARLVAPGAAPLFAATGVYADEPVSRVYQLLRTDTGARGTPGALQGQVTGLSLRIRDAVPHSPFVIRNDVVVTFQPRPGMPVDAEGSIQLSEDQVLLGLTIPYRVEAPRGKVRLTLTAPATAQPLPWCDDDPWTVTIEGLDANVPEAIPLVPASPDVRLDPPVDRWGTARVRLVLKEGRTLATETLVPLGTSARVDFEVAGIGRIRPRRPTLRADATADGLQLVADPDGGDAAWQAGVFGVIPTVTSPDHAFRWALEEEARGRWRVVAAETDPAIEPGVFQGDERKIPLRISWPPGAVPDGVSITHVTPARWGAKGFVLVALAVLAAALGLAILLLMRPPAVDGTLLYAIEGVEGAVGRLDLAPVGRGQAELRSSPKGLLHLGGGGERLGRIAATRVGGFLELESRRLLLVDGLTVAVGRHRIRYVSGRGEGDGPAPPPAVPDLLGPEFDLESGRIEGEAGGPSERS